MSALVTASSNTNTPYVNHQDENSITEGSLSFYNYESPSPSSATIIIPQVMKQESCVASFAETASLTDETVSLVSLVSDLETVTKDAAVSSGGAVKLWNGKTLFSDFIREGLLYQQRPADDVIMLFESPTSWMTQDSSFYNSLVYKFHDYPRSPQPSKAVLGPCRYTLMNGSTYPSYLHGSPPEGLIEHWKKTVPKFVEPTFVSSLGESSQVYAYLPMEHIHHPLNDPHIHYHLAGKDAIRLMTPKTTKLYSNTKDHRPCIVKTTHSMGSKGIFVIRNDEDEAEFNAFLTETGNPTFIITEFIEIARNVACHFFMHPNGDITWFGSNENHQTADGDWSCDSHIVMADQEQLRDMQLPFVKDVVQYCHSLGFWGSCGVDVLFDHSGKGYLVDVNPRVTGSCPAIMVSHLLQESYGMEYCLFRRSTHHAFPGPAKDLLQRVETFNEEHCGKFLLVVYSFYEESPTVTLVNLGVHATTCMDDCEAILNQFVPSL